jgi:hypothetical protein
MVASYGNILPNLDELFHIPATLFFSLALLVLLDTKIQLTSSISTAFFPNDNGYGML